MNRRKRNEIWKNTKGIVNYTISIINFTYYRLDFMAYFESIGILRNFLKQKEKENKNKNQRKRLDSVNLILKS